MNNRDRGGGQPGGRALAEDGTPSKDKDGAYADEATGFLQVRNVRFRDVQVP